MSSRTSRTSTGPQHGVASVRRRVRVLARVVALTLGIAFATAGCAPDGGTATSAHRTGMGTGTATAPATDAPPASDPPTAPSDPPVVPDPPVDPPVDYEASFPPDRVRVTDAGYQVSTCVPERLDAGVFTLTTEDGVHLSVLEVGSGPRAVVLSHEQGYSICSWLALAQDLAQDGYHVMTFDYRNHGASELSSDNDNIDRDLQVVVEEMHRRGGERFLLGGASCGGTASAVVGAREPDLVGLLILSSPAQCARIDGEAAVRQIEQPSFFAVSPGDMAGAVQDEVERLYAASAAADKHLEIDESGYHGTDMLHEWQSARPTPLLGLVRDHIDRAFDQAGRTG